MASPETPDSVKLWINTVFRSRLLEICERPETQMMLKVGRDKGDSVGEILAITTSHVVMQIAGMDPNEW